MVSIATGNDDQPEDDDVGNQGLVNGNSNGPAGGSQYFLITPKLLHGLRYERGMRVLCIASGEYMPDDQMQVNFKRSLEIRRGQATAAG
jgi:hypothetical protein